MKINIKNYQSVNTNMLSLYSMHDSIAISPVCLSDDDVFPTHSGLPRLRWTVHCNIISARA